jgi:hypothetical protein
MKANREPCAGGAPIVEPGRALLGARFVQMKGDSMTPTIEPGDFFAVVPVDIWRGGGIYYLDFGAGPAPQLARPLPDGRIALRYENPSYAGADISPAQFFAALRGKVFATCRMLDPGAVLDREGGRA